VGASGAPGSSGNRAYAFGPFVADTLTRRLWREGQPIPITAKTFDVLAVLLEHRDRLVTKDELLDRVWPDTAVQENNLARQVSSLRRALGQRPDEADFVLTVSGQGYRFVSNAQEISELPGGLRDANGVHHVVPPERPGDSNDGPAEDGLPTSPASVTVHAGLESGSSSAATQRRSAATVVGIAALLVSVGLAVTLLRRNDSSPETGRTLQRVTFDDAGLSRDASFSPDGQWIVFVSDRGGHTDLWKQRIGDPDPERLTTSAAIESQPEWSPDGRAIVFRSERDGGGLYLIPAAGGDERMASNFGYEPRWSSDSTRILFKRSVVLPDLPTIYVVGVDGRPPQPVRPDVLARFGSLQASWHPDGRRVSIWGTDQHGKPTFLNVPLDAREGRPSTMSAAVQRNLAGITPRRFVWAPSRRYIFFEGVAGDTNNVWRITADPSTEELTDGPVRLTTGTGRETSVALSPDGKRIVFTSSSSRTRLWAFPLDGSSGRIVGEPHPITRGTTGEVDFDANADGSKVAYRAVRAGRNELWERSLGEGRERLLLSSPDGKLVKPRWSPDGAKLAFLRCGNEGGAPVLAVLNADGSGERALTRPTEVEMLASDWSNSGESILGSCRFNRSDRYSTCVLPVSSNSSPGTVRVVASDPKRNLFNQRFSPDQRWIAFLAHDLMYNATSTVYVIPSAGGAWRPMTDGAVFDDKPRWGPDGRVLYYVSDRDGVKNVWGRRFDNTNGVPEGDPFPVTSFRSPQFLISPQAVQMDIAITATHLMIPMSESRGDIWMLDHVDR
jgi:Tol biopolymer transport system component/DNA-binding winged helix-turn-helix (wHTH) protein